MIALRTMRRVACAKLGSKAKEQSLCGHAPPRLRRRAANLHPLSLVVYLGEGPLQRVASLIGSTELFEQRAANEVHVGVVVRVEGAIWVPVIMGEGNCG